MPTLDGGGAPGIHRDRYSLDEIRAMAAELDGGREVVASAGTPRPSKAPHLVGFVWRLKLCSILSLAF